MNKFLNFISFVGLLIVYEVGAMDSFAYWKDILDKTKASTSFAPLTDGYSEDAENAFGGAETKINWDNIKLAADKGNSLAQYVHSQHLFALSRSLFNGERLRMRFDAYIYLLVAAVKGNFPQAVESFNYAVDFTYSIPTFDEEGEASNKAALEWILKEAGKLSKK